MDVDALEHRLLAVCENDMVDLQIAVDPRERPRAGTVVDLRLLVENGRDLDHRRSGRLQLSVHVGELLERLEDELEEIERRDERPDRQRLAAEKLAADVQDG